MLSVSKLARACGLSRTTLLYYESIELMKSARRASGNYRCYGDKDVQRLQQICAYRGAGFKLEDMRALLDGSQTDAASTAADRNGC